MARGKKQAPDDMRVIPIIAETVFRNVVKGYAVAMRAVKDAQEGAKEVIAKAIDKKHLHKAAFNLWYKLDNMRPDKRSELLHHFDHYRACSDWDDQLDLFRKKVAEGTSEDEASDVDHDNVVQGDFEGATAH
jgi:hypothetical protein